MDKSGSSELRPEVEAEVRLRQCVQIARVTPRYVAFAIIAMITISADEWRAPHLLLLSLDAWVILAGIVVWRATAPERAADVRRVSIGRARLYDAMWGAIGLSTGSVLSAIAAYVAVQGQSIADALACSVIAIGVVVSSRRRAAYAYVLCASVPATWRMVHLGGPGPAILLGEFAALMLSAIWYADRTFRCHVASEIMLDEQRRLTEILLHEFEDGSDDWLWRTDADMALTHVSGGAVVGPHLIGTRLLDWLRIASSGRDPGITAIEDAVHRRLPFRSVVLEMVLDGECRAWSLTGRPVMDADGRFAGYGGMGSDVTVKREARRRIDHMAHHDSLTDLPNRALFQLTSERMFAGRARGNFALMIVDLDGFKAVNDLHGHAVGDELLVVIARRLADCLAEGTGGEFVARLGGDEFAILVPGSGIEQVERLATRLIASVSEPSWLDQLRLHVIVGASIGIAFASSQVGEMTDLVRRADLALYRAKFEGRGTWRFFEPEMDERVRARSSLQADLRQAIADGSLDVHFQPIVDLSTLRVISCEALARWRHPTRGWIMPADFIGVAEETGLIVPLGRWVLERACVEAMRWPDDVCVTVNVSPIQFRDPHLMSTVDDILAMTGLAPGRLEIEITESVLLEAAPATLRCLQTLRHRGIRISLDDFGTGCSSLAYLRQFSFDTLKIDRSFVGDMRTFNEPGGDLLEGDQSTAIIQAVIGMARSLNMTTIAEGVETEAQLQTLRERGCSHVQGYLFSRPVSGDALLASFATRWEYGEPRPDAVAQAPAAERQLVVS